MSTPFSLAIVGSRDFQDQKLFDIELGKFVEQHGLPALFVSGGARGADSMGERWAIRHGVPTKILLPDWNTHGKKAGILRNTDIVASCDHLIAFHKDNSKGTADSIAKATKRLGSERVHIVQS